MDTGVRSEDAGSSNTGTRPTSPIHDGCDGTQDQRGQRERTAATLPGWTSSPRSLSRPESPAMFAPSDTAYTASRTCTCSSSTCTCSSTNGNHNNRNTDQGKRRRQCSSYQQRCCKPTSLKLSNNVPKRPKGATDGLVWDALDAWCATTTAIAAAATTATTTTTTTTTTTVTTTTTTAATTTTTTTTGTAAAARLLLSQTAALFEAALAVDGDNVLGLLGQRCFVRMHPELIPVPRDVELEADLMARAKRVPLARVYRAQRELQAAEHPNLLTLLGLVQLHLLNNASAAARVLQRAVDAGGPEAMFLLSRCYEAGQGVPPNPTRALDLRMRALDAGCLVAAVDLGWCYEHGVLVPMSIPKAMHMYKTAADAGVALGMHSLAVCHDKAHHIALAVPLYRSAADLGSMLAYEQLGRLYDQGLGCAKDRAEAMRCYRIALEQGSETAERHLQALTGSQAQPLPGHDNDNAANPEPVQG